MPSIDMSFFGLNRPEYVPAPELILSDLIWSRSSKDARNNVVAESPGGLAYGSFSAKPDKAVRFTKPESDSAKFRELAHSLGERFGLDDRRSRRIAAVLCDEIEIYASQKTTRSVAIPLTIELALLQNRRGVTGKANPPNVALIVEQIYALGRGEGLASVKLGSALRDAGSAGLPDWIFGMAQHFLPAFCEPARADILGNVEAIGVDGLRSPAWLHHARDTPFNWFAKAWLSLTNNGWIDAMPRRRWTDWATCVARTAVATSYLFEMHITYRFVAALVTDEAANDVLSQSMKMSRRLFSWDDRKSKAVMDVGPMINSLSSAGATCLAFLGDLRERYPSFPAPAEYDDNPEGISDWLVHARAAIEDNKDEVKRLLSDAFESAAPSSAKNIRETIRYSLLGRGGTESSDLYGMLQSASRYTWVAPGQEWLVTVASLCSSSPGKPARLADLTADLRSLGIAVSGNTIVSRLESFGLARSSHDADEALEIQPAF